MSTRTDSCSQSAVKKVATSFDQVVQLLNANEEFTVAPNVTKLLFPDWFAIFSASKMLGDARLERLVSALKDNNSVEELGLGWSNLSNVSAELLGNWLKTNHSLKFLNLFNNHIDDEGVIKLAEGIRLNNSLQELNLNHNHIGSRGVHSLLSAIEDSNNTSLRVIKTAAGNSIDRGTESRLGTALGETPRAFRAGRRLATMTPPSPSLVSQSSTTESKPPSPFPSPNSLPWNSSLPRPASSPSSSSSPSLPSRSLHEVNPRLEMTDAEVTDLDASSSGYRGAFSIPEDYAPTDSCVNELLLNADSLGLKRVETIVEEGKRWLSHFLSHDERNPYQLDENEVLSLGLYTFNLRWHPLDENLYRVLNEMLRARSSTKMMAWRGYLYYLVKALHKIPDQDSTLYRGSRNVELVKEQYTTGRLVHWSAFSSTSKDINVAREFATEQGVVFRIRALTAKDISDYSFFGKKENELLLVPNLNFLVINPLHVDPSDGLMYVDLFQQLGSKLIN